MPANMLTSPRCRPDELGLPIPDDLHAASACLPLWEHNVAYEEGDAAVHDALQAAYPRFRLHPLTQELCEQQLQDDGWQGLPFASQRAAWRANEYVHFHGVERAMMQALTDDPLGPTGVLVSDEHFATLKQYWQHAGENLSSRGAQQILNNESVASTDNEARRLIKTRVAELHGLKSDDVFLFPTGMAAIAAAWRVVRSGVTDDEGWTCQFGFPYVDTLKIQERFINAECAFYPLGDDDSLQHLRERCASEPPLAVFVETPTNPLLATPDVITLRQLADEFGFLIIIDDTLGACLNIRAIEFADIVVTSLTKYFSGEGNVLAGSLVVNPASRRADEVRTLVATDFEELLIDDDCEVLEENSRDLRARVEAINANAAELASFLRSQPNVESVFYPDQCDNYSAIRRPDGGYGGLLSIVLHDPETAAPKFYDRLEVCKGPNLGTHFTLACPFTILAHFEELDWAESCGVSRWLVRVSVGVEPIEELKSRFLSALQ